MSNKKPLKGQFFLFTNTGDRKPWTPPSELPSLDGVKSLAMDNETTGKNKKKDKPVGVAYRTDDGRKFYLPTGHAGGNLDPERVREWKRRELRNKLIINLNTGFDAETELNDGVDLEAQGCQLYDVAHAAALLNENRYSGFNLHDLGLEYCNRPKRDDHLEKDRMADYHSSMVAEYAMDDADLAWEVYQAQRPLIKNDGLEKVDDLESKLIWANNHMERSGARMDLAKMDSMTQDLVAEVGEITMRIWEKTGVKLDPGKNVTWDRLFISQNMDPHQPLVGSKGEAKSSYTNDYLKGIKNEFVQQGLRIQRLLSLKSKYFAKFPKTIVGDILHFQLFQLRAGEEEQGTVVGRYSATNFPIQTCFKVENQIKKYGDGYIVRELMIPDDGYDFFAADGSQLQFRLFAHLSQDKDLIRAYHEGYQRWLKGFTCPTCMGGERCSEHKDVDFHQMVADLFTLRRQDAKTNNFALVMGMGRATLAGNLGKSCNCQPPHYWWWTGDRDTFKKFEDNDNHAEDCPAREANNLADEYEKKFPAAGKTMEMVVKFAKQQGFVPTLLGRRRRYAEYEQRGAFRQKTRYYKALASWLQGSEADIAKSKLLRIYNERNNIGIHKLRMPMHDEITGDIEKSEKVRERLREVLRIQEIPTCRVPISWADEYGVNWRACSGK
jgi:DNA polymerase-1